MVVEWEGEGDSFLGGGCRAMRQSGAGINGRRCEGVQGRAKKEVSKAIRERGLGALAELQKYPC